MATSFDDITQPISSFFYPGRGANEPLSYQSLVMRRKIAEALMGKRSPYPKNIGEGLAALGGAIGDRAYMDKLDAEEKAYAEEQAKDTRIPGQSDETPAERPITSPAYRAPGAAQRSLTSGTVMEEPEPLPQSQPQPTRAPPPLATPAQYTPPQAAPSGPSGVGELTPDMLLREGRNRGEPIPLPLGSVPPLTPGPRSSLGDPRSALTMAALAQQGVIPPDPTMGADTPPPGPMVAALGAGPTASDAPLIGMPGDQLAQAAPFADRFVNPMLPQPDIKTIPRGVPGPLTPPTRAPEVPIIAARPDLFMDPGPEPKLPTPRSKPTNDEMIGYQLLRKYPGDPAQKARADQFIKFGQQQRADEYARGVEEYKAQVEIRKKKIELLNQRQIDAPEREARTRLIEGQIAKQNQDAQDKLDQGGMSNEEIATILKESRKSVETAPVAMAAFNRVQQLLDQNPKMFTGTFAEQKLAVGKFAAAMGRTPNPSLSPTEEFNAVIAPIVAQQRQMLVGNANISDPDREAALKAAAGSIKLEPETIRNVMKTMQIATIDGVVAHNKKIATAAGDKPDKQRMYYGMNEVDMSLIVPKVLVERLRNGPQTAERYKAFDDKFHYPGLGRRLVGF